MSPSLRRLYALWHQPGREMRPGWWGALKLPEWREPYVQQPLVRPALDRLIASRLGHSRSIPEMSPAAEALLMDERRDLLCVALGLWALGCPEYLVLQQYRKALSPVLDRRALGQLLVLMPLRSVCEAQLAPDELLEGARRCGLAWLGSSDDPAVLACRLLWEPASPERNGRVAPEAVLEKLLRWL
ncbi:type III secretion system domain-containing protein [Paraburkholderia sp. RL17-373-BIF-A]|uniref:type III secretion system domain-containing protein n=1 Tax=Paraburkholderia sp. RL17-373-BIF-A TaxID=3031629 RepID=UPI0038B93FD9